MTVEKSEIKMNTASAIGSKLEDMAEAAQRSAHQLEGAHGALMRLGRQMETLLASTDKRVDVGELELDEAKLVKGAVTKCIALTSQSAREALQQSIAADGRFAGMQAAVAATKAMYDLEASKAKAVEEAEQGEGRRGGRRQTGVRPVSKLEERRAEAKAEKEAAKPTQGTPRKRRKTAVKKKKS